MKWGCQVKDVVVKQGEKDDIFSLSIPELQIFVDGGEGVKLPLMGVSGGGKSTLLNLLAAMEWPKNGDVSWSFPDGENIRWDHMGLSAHEAKRLRSRYFGFAFQDSTLILHLTIWDNLCYPLQLKGITIRDAREMAKDALNKVLLKDENEKLDEILQRFPSQLSGGQRQRVAVVQAMIHNPYVLFADEPTGSLDPSTRRQVMDVLDRWVREKEGERLLFWVTHHENDPQDNGVKLRLWVYSASSSPKRGYLRWERYRGPSPDDWEECG